MEPDIAYEQAVALYDESIGEPDEAQRDRQLREAIALLQPTQTQSSQTADALHLLGICWYDLSTGDEALDQAKTAFVAALVREPNHQYANLFLGHVLFDTHQYDEALFYFGRVDPDYFAARGQSWRGVKNSELILCCRLALNPADVTLDDIDRVCRQYEREPEIGVVPGELTLSIDEVVASAQLSGEQAAAYARRVLTMLEQTQNLSVRYLKATIARLSRLG